MTVANRVKLYVVREARSIHRQDRSSTARKASGKVSGSVTECETFDVPVVRHGKYSLDELLKGVNSDNLHLETKTGHSVGREF